MYSASDISRQQLQHGFTDRSSIRQAPLYNNQMAAPYPPQAPPAVSVPRSPMAPPPPIISNVVDGKRYSLEVLQQPIRARMCGFGDKDRRPITPPPCIRLTVVDVRTNRPVDINEIDTSYFILTVDLWSPDATREVNLVRHSATSPSISATTSSSYPPPNAPAGQFQYPGGSVPMTQVHVGLAQSPYPQHPSQPYGYPPANPADPYAAQYGHPHAHYQQPPPGPPSHDSMSNQPRSYYTNTNGQPVTPVAPSYATQGPLLSPGMVPAQDPRSAPAGMFTRNLIGSLCVSAFKLTDPQGELGVWFILQDLSVRTEGSFRLKMNFVNVGSQNNPSTLNTGSAPVLASTFSDVFQVFSAKKFPGVIESTALSKCFATQGIKIPIRKDGVNNRREDEDD